MCYSFIESKDSVQTQHVFLQSLALRMQRYGKLTEENISGGTDMGKSTVYFTDFRCPVGTRIRCRRISDGSLKQY